MSTKGGDSTVKVRVIETQFVRTDVINFKTVVQKLTGKVSDITTAPERKPRAGEQRQIAEEISEEEYFRRMLMALQGTDQDEL